MQSHDDGMRQSEAEFLYLLNVVGVGGLKTHEKHKVGFLGCELAHHKPQFAYQPDYLVLTQFKLRIGNLPRPG